MGCNEDWGSGYGCSWKSYAGAYQGQVAEGGTEADKHKQY